LAALRHPRKPPERKIGLTRYIPARIGAKKSKESLKNSTLTAGDEPSILFYSTIGGVS